MQEIIQNITFPQNDMLEEHSKLYYRGAEGVLLHENEKKYLVLPAFQQTMRSARWLQTLWRKFPKTA